MSTSIDSSTIPYHPAPLEDSNEKDTGFQRSLSNASRELMRSVTQYTEYDVAIGHAMEEAKEEQEMKDHPSSNDEESSDANTPPQPAFKFFSKSNIPFFRKYMMIVLIMIIFVFSVFSIYWGSMFHRNSRLTNLTVLLVTESDESLPLSQALINVSKEKLIASKLGYVIKSNISEDEVIDKVYKQKYWGAIYVNNNTVSNLITDAFKNGDDSDLNTTDFVKCYYETGRDLNGMRSYVEPPLLEFSIAFQNYLHSTTYPSIISNLTSDEFSKLRNSNLLTSYPSIQFTDGKPASDPVVLAPLQIGLIYIIILTFFQFMWFLQIHGEMAKKLSPIRYILYRMIASQFNYLCLSLGYSALNAAFQISFNKTWSGGFGVMWMISYLTMSAVGGANENIGLLCFATLPPVMGFWMIFFVITNISATFSPIPVCPGLFRFTEAMPIKNSYELMKILLFDTYKGNQGRHWGILIAWIALNNLLLPLCLMFFSFRMKKTMAKAASASAANKK
ncbi:hypothetical protein CANARDRAFT_9673 [[Candida] arabinofermentans NRRL YB-2248]|uniref:DUF3533 domain-containing protein n=1 Tax=[Candida] arabinofermentans NRRL YB-2248 TaxID=983967 RepID=A0A1E4SUT4_9ASCO|nr:hypothetical protein CANARDRAFT_9673 [[Candida] arabinofermentans NRRL YB-2248]